MSFCAISDEGLEVLASTQTALNSLSLRGCTAISDKGLVSLSASLLGLSDLSLGSCESLTDTGLSALRRLRWLKSLNLQYCDVITDGGIAYLVEGLPYLVHLNTDQMCDNNLRRWRAPVTRGMGLLRSGCKTVQSIGIKPNVTLRPVLVLRPNLPNSHGLAGAKCFYIGFLRQRGTGPAVSNSLLVQLANPPYAAGTLAAGHSAGDAHS